MRAGRPFQSQTGNPVIVVGCIVGESARPFILRFVRSGDADGILSRLLIAIDEPRGRELLAAIFARASSARNVAEWLGRGRIDEEAFCVDETVCSGVDSTVQ